MRFRHALCGLFGASRIVVFLRNLNGHLLSLNRSLLRSMFEWSRAFSGTDVYSLEEFLDFFFL